MCASQVISFLARNSKRKLKVKKFKTVTLNVNILLLACIYYGNKIAVEEKAWCRGNASPHATKLAL
jgi:hypothetical protein